MIFLQLCTVASYLYSILLRNINHCHSSKNRPGKVAIFIASPAFFGRFDVLDKSVERQLQKGVKGALIPICLAWPISFMPNYLQPEMLLILSKIGSNIYLS